MTVAGTTSLGYAEMISAADSGRVYRDRMQGSARTVADRNRYSNRPPRHPDIPRPAAAGGDARARILRRRRRTVVLASLVILAGVLLLARGCPALVSNAGSGVAEITGSTAPPQSSTSAPPPIPTLRAGPVDVAVDGFVSWALLDRTTGQTAGSANLTATSTTESMIKVWIVADFLRRSAAAGTEPSADDLAMASTAIRDSDDTAAQRLYNRGGGAPVIERLTRTCGLTDTRAVVPPGSTVVWWSFTQMSARDAVRMGACVADGQAAGPRWTSWLLTEMAQVRGTANAKDQYPTHGGGRWGIIEGLPATILAQGVAIKNGWTLHSADGMWHVNCLAVNPRWVLAVMIKYPGKYGLQYGADTCKRVAQELASPA